MSKIPFGFAITIPAVLLLGCTTAPEEPEAKIELRSNVQEAIDVFKFKDPTIQRFFDTSYGYAVLPKVVKGAVWVGGFMGEAKFTKKAKWSVTAICHRQHWVSLSAANLFAKLFSSEIGKTWRLL